MRIFCITDSAHTFSARLSRHKPLAELICYLHTIKHINKSELALIGLVATVFRPPSKTVAGDVTEQLMKGISPTRHSASAAPKSPYRPVQPHELQA